MPIMRNLWNGYNMRINWDKLRVIAKAIKGDNRFKNFRFWMVGTTIKGQAYAQGYWFGGTYHFVIKRGRLKSILGPF